jgi:hypothetical protein
MDLQSAGLEGTLPTCLGNLFLLNTLVLTHNKLRGTIPPEFGWIKVLKDLDLRYNWLSGSILVEAISNLSKLTSLDLGLNMHCGRIP